MDEVLETTRHVVERSRQVRIDRPSLERFLGERLQGPLRLPPWDASRHLQDRPERTVAYLLVLDTLNFCFWPPPGEEKWHIRYGSLRLDGYYALATALKTAVEAGLPILDPAFLARATPDRLADILGGRGRLQLMRQRAANLNELGRVLAASFGGEAVRVVEGAAGSAVRLAILLSEKLASFRDSARYGGREVFFLKRAQIVAADLYGSFGGKGWGAFSDMDRLTAFADYKLPQVLRHLGILRYRRDLAEKVDRLETLPPGSAEEVEIRAGTVWCVELMRRELDRKGCAARPFEIDWFLWNLGQAPKFSGRPYHRTPTIYY